MIGYNNINCTVINPLQQRLAVRLIAQRRCELGKGAVIANVDFVQAEMINGDAGRNLKIARFCAAYHAQRLA